MDNCKLCGELLDRDTGRYDWEDAKGLVWDICGVCREYLARKDKEVEAA